MDVAPQRPALDAVLLVTWMELWREVQRWQRGAPLLGFISAGTCWATTDSISGPHCSSPRGRRSPLAEMRAQRLRELKSCAQGYTADRRLGQLPLKWVQEMGPKFLLDPVESKQEPGMWFPPYPEPYLPPGVVRCLRRPPRPCGPTPSRPPPPSPPALTPHIETGNTAHFTGIGTTSPYAVTFL